VVVVVVVVPLFVAASPVSRTIMNTHAMVWFDAIDGMAMAWIMDGGAGWRRNFAD